MNKGSLALLGMAGGGVACGQGQCAGARLSACCFLQGWARGFKGSESFQGVRCQVS